MLLHGWHAHPVAGEWFELMGKKRLCPLLAEAEALAVGLQVHRGGVTAAELFPGHRAPPVIYKQPSFVQIVVRYGSCQQTNACKPTRAKHPTFCLPRLDYLAGILILNQEDLRESGRNIPC